MPHFAGAISPHYNCGATSLSKEEFYDYPDLRDRRFYAISLSEGGPPYLRRNFTTIPDPRDRSFYATSLSEGGRPYPRRNFTTILIRRIEAFILHPYSKEDSLIQGRILRLPRSAK
jgi:hypothetical protein